MEKNKQNSTEVNNNVFYQKKWGILFITVLSTFMNTLDSSIVNVALPTMANDLKVTTGAIAWVVSTYLIVVSVLILFFGRLGDLKGQAKVFRFGLLDFTLGSLLCGMTHSFQFLLAARALQAIGAAACMANSQGIITRTFPPEERGRALGVNGAFVALGTMVGPALGGLILSFASWEYLFWINVPVGIIAMVANIKIFSGFKESTKQEKLDIAGTLLFIVGMTPFFFALEDGQRIGYGNPIIWGSLLFSVVALTGFLLLERRVKVPLLDLHIFKNKWFSISIFCAFISFIAIMCSNMILPFYLQNALKMSPGMAGLFMTISPLVLVLVSPLSGYLSDKIGSEILTLIGLLLTCIGLLCMASLNDSPVLWVLGFFIGLMSLGNGLFQSPNNSLVMSMVPSGKLGIGGSINALVRNIGMVVGIAMSTTLLYGGMSAKIGYLVTDFVEGRNDAFLYGMRLAYLTAAGICLIGCVVTAIRMFQTKKGTGVLE